MSRVVPQRQRGAALLVLLAILALGASWFLVSKLDALQLDFTARERERNAAVLKRAKQALIGYVAAKAAQSGEDNPGALPCPEHPWYIGMPDKEGTMGPAVGVPSPGYGTANCASIGRFPWRSLGTEPLLDARGEPLWYVVGPGWRKTSTSTLTVINSNTAGDIGVDGQAVVALLVAPGPAMSAQAGTTPAGTACAARNQARSAPAGTMDPADYLECFNAGTLQFSTSGPSASFNDQAVAITVADLMPGIEAAIANRIEREIAPQLKAVYASNTWGTNVSAAAPVYPYPAPFANPGTTASYQGAATSCASSVCAGLLPVIFTNTPGSTTALCTPGGSSLCDPMFVKWASGTIEVKSVTVGGVPYVPGILGTMVWGATVTNCTVTSSGTPASSSLSCNAYVPSSSGLVTTNVIYEVRGDADNVAMSLRSFEPTANLGLTVTTTPTVAMGNTGRGAVVFRGSTTAPTTAPTVLPSLCGLSGTLLAGVQCRLVTISVPLTPLFPDHPLLDSTHATWGWFMRNEWFRLTYYAAAQGNTATSLPSAPACTNGSTCLTVANVTPAGRQRALLILAGRSINGVARPTATVADYLESGNATGSFERQTVTVSAASVYLDAGVANTYILASGTPIAGQPLQFRATNANTGASTLTSFATGTRALVDSNGVALSAGQIKANAVVEVTYDGTRFLLSKRLFNDRLIVVDSN